MHVVERRDLLPLTTLFQVRALRDINIHEVPLKSYVPLTHIF